MDAEGRRWLDTQGNTTNLVLKVPLLVTVRFAFHQFLAGPHHSRVVFAMGKRVVRLLFVYCVEAVTRVLADNVPVPVRGPQQVVVGIFRVRARTKVHTLVPISLQAQGLVEGGDVVPLAVRGCTWAQA